MFQRFPSRWIYCRLVLHFLYRISDQDTADEKGSYLVNCLLHLFDRHGPWITVKRTIKKAPWLADIAKIMMHLRDWALVRYKRTRLKAHRYYYRILRNLTNKVIDPEKRAFFAFKFQKSQPKELWQNLRENKVITDKIVAFP